MSLEAISAPTGVGVGNGLFTSSDQLARVAAARRAPEPPSALYAREQQLPSGSSSASRHSPLASQSLQAYGLNQWAAAAGIDLHSYAYQISQLAVSAPLAAAPSACNCPPPVASHPLAFEAHELSAVGGNGKSLGAPLYDPNPNLSDVYSRLCHEMKPFEHTCQPQVRLLVSAQPLNV